MTDPNETEKRDMLELRGKAQAWIDSLQVAGMSENAIVTAIHLALIERALVRGGVEQTATWLRGMVAMVESQGPQLLRELPKQGR